MRIYLARSIRLRRKDGIQPIAQLRRPAKSFDNRLGYGQMDEGPSSSFDHHYRTGVRVFTMGRFH